MENDSPDLSEKRNDFIQFIWANRKFIIYFTGASFIISLVVSLLITPLYLSTAIVFPAASSTVSFSEQRNAKTASMDFGEEEQAEQLVQILQSSKIRDRIVKKFSLLEHYEIDSDDVNKNYKLTKAYEGHFTFTRTRFGSIKIDVLDRDPKLAAKMANSIVELIDSVKNEMISQRTIPAFDINKRKKEQLEREINQMNVELDSLSAKGVMSFNSRSGLFEAYVGASGSDRADMKEKIDMNIKFGSKYDGLERLRNEKISKLEEFQIAFEQAESDANTKFNHKFVVESAVVADKKDQPKRLIIVLVASIGAMIFSLFILLVQQRIKELKQLK
jgi:tyrosine-protein kinase Etk/Wzc